MITKYFFLLISISLMVSQSINVLAINGLDNDSVQPLSTQHSVTWTSSSVRFVEIQLIDLTLSTNTILASKIDASMGSYPIVLPYSFFNNDTANYVIRIYDYENYATFDSRTIHYFPNPDLRVWTGNQDSDFFRAENWENELQPNNATDIAFIPANKGNIVFTNNIFTTPDSLVIGGLYVEDNSTVNLRDYLLKCDFIFTTPYGNIVDSAGTGMIRYFGSLVAGNFNVTFKNENPIHFIGTTSFFNDFENSLLNNDIYANAQYIIFHQIFKNYSNLVMTNEADSILFMDSTFFYSQSSSYGKMTKGAMIFNNSIYQANNDSSFMPSESHREYIYANVSSYMEAPDTSRFNNLYVMDYAIFMPNHKLKTKLLYISNALVDARYIETDSLYTAGNANVGLSNDTDSLIVNNWYADLYDNVISFNYGVVVLKGDLEFISDDYYPNGMLFHNKKFIIVDNPLKPFRVFRKLFSDPYSGFFINIDSLFIDINGEINFDQTRLETQKFVQLNGDIIANEQLVVYQSLQLNNAFNHYFYSLNIKFPFLLDNAENLNADNLYIDQIGKYSLNNNINLSHIENIWFNNLAMTDSLFINGHHLIANNINIQNSGYIRMLAGDSLSIASLSLNNVLTALNAGILTVSQHLYLTGSTVFSPDTAFITLLNGNSYQEIFMNNQGRENGKNHFSKLIFRNDYNTVMFNTDSNLYSPFYIQRFIVDSGTLSLNSYKNNKFIITKEFSGRQLTVEGSSLELDSALITRMDTISFQNYGMTNQDLLIIKNHSTNADLNNLYFYQRPDSGVYYVNISGFNNPVININDIFADSFLNHFKVSGDIQVNINIPELMTDSMLLVSLYNASNGISWSQQNNWLSTNPLNTWHGVTTDANGNVTSLDLSYCGINANDLVFNYVSNLDSLRQLNLSNNNLYGEIPTSLDNLTALNMMNLTHNNFYGRLPLLTSIDSLYLAYNYIDSVEQFSIMPDTIDIRHNRLDFGDLLYAFPSTDNLAYIDQDVDMQYEYFEPYLNDTIKRFGTIRNAENYFWLKDGNPYSSGELIEIVAINSSVAGQYEAIATNSLFPGLELRSKAFFISPINLPIAFTKWTAQYPQEDSYINHFDNIFLYANHPDSLQSNFTDSAIKHITLIDELGNSYQFQNAYLDYTGDSWLLRLQIESPQTKTGIRYSVFVDSLLFDNHGKSLGTYSYDFYVHAYEAFNYDYSLSSSQTISLPADSNILKILEYKSDPLNSHDFTMTVLHKNPAGTELLLNNYRFIQDNRALQLLDQNVFVKSIAGNFKLNEVKLIFADPSRSSQLLISSYESGTYNSGVFDFDLQSYTEFFGNMKSVLMGQFDHNKQIDFIMHSTADNSVRIFFNLNQANNSFESVKNLFLPNMNNQSFIRLINGGEEKPFLVSYNTVFGNDSISIFELDSANNAFRYQTLPVDLGDLSNLIDFRIYPINSDYDANTNSYDANIAFYFIGENKTKLFSGELDYLSGVFPGLTYNQLSSYRLLSLGRDAETQFIYSENDTLFIEDYTGSQRKQYAIDGYTELIPLESEVALFNIHNGQFNIYTNNYIKGNTHKVGYGQTFASVTELLNSITPASGDVIQYVADPAYPKTFIEESAMINLPVFIYGNDSIVIQPITSGQTIFEIASTVRYGEIKNIYFSDKDQWTSIAIRYSGLYQHGIVLDNLTFKHFFIGINAESSAIYANNNKFLACYTGISTSETDTTSSNRVEISDSEFRNNHNSAILQYPLTTLVIDNSVFINDTTTPGSPLIYGYYTGSNSHELIISNSHFEETQQTAIRVSNENHRNIRFDLQNNFFKNNNSIWSENNALIDIEYFSGGFIANNRFKNSSFAAFYIHHFEKYFDDLYVINNVFDNVAGTNNDIFSYHINEDSILKFYNNLFLNNNSVAQYIVRNGGSSKAVYGNLISDLEIIETDTASQNWGINLKLGKKSNVYSKITSMRLDTNYYFLPGSFGIDMGLTHPNWPDIDMSVSNIGYNSGIFVTKGLTERVLIEPEIMNDSLLIHPFALNDNNLNLDAYYIFAGDSANFIPLYENLLMSTSNLRTKLNSGMISADKYYKVQASHKDYGVISTSNVAQQTFMASDPEIMQDSLVFTVNENTTDSIAFTIMNPSLDSVLVSFNAALPPFMQTKTGPKFVYTGTTNKYIRFNTGSIVSQEYRFVGRVYLIKSAVVIDSINIVMYLNRKAEFAVSLINNTIPQIFNSSFYVPILNKSPFVREFSIEIEKQTYLSANWIDVDTLKHIDAGVKRDSLEVRINTTTLTPSSEALRARIYIRDSVSVVDSVFINLNFSTSSVYQLSFSPANKVLLKDTLYYNGFVLNWAPQPAVRKYKLIFESKSEGNYIVFKTDSVSQTKYEVTNLGDASYRIILTDIDNSLQIKNDTLRFSIKDRWLFLGKSYWQMLSSNAKVTGNLKSLFNNYDGQIFEWNSTLADYVALNTDTVQVKNAKAYWIKPQNKMIYQLENQRYSDQETVSIELAKGWNQLGNPWNFSIVWGEQEISTDNGATWTKIKDADNTNFIAFYYLTTFDIPTLSKFVTDTVALNNLFSSDTAYTYLPINTRFGGIFSFIWPQKGFWFFSKEKALLRFSAVQSSSSISKLISDDIQINIAVKQSNFVDQLSFVFNNRKERIVTQLPPFINHQRQFSLKETQGHAYSIIRNQNDLLEYSEETMIFKYYKSKRLKLNIENSQLVYLWIYHIERQEKIRVESEAIDIEMREGRNTIKLYFSQSADFEPATIPVQFVLKGNYPNPFNPTTTIEFELPYADELYKTEVSIYNILGQKIKTIVKGYLGSTVHKYKWDATNDQGQKVASGIYFYTIQAGRFTQSRKMVLIK